jgi:hypothetical protein
MCERLGKILKDAVKGLAAGFAGQLLTCIVHHFAISCLRVPPFLLDVDVSGGSRLSHIHQDLCTDVSRCMCGL